jgi:multiple sugar transport system substrate-binding protein
MRGKLFLGAALILIVGLSTGISSQAANQETVIKMLISAGGSGKAFQGGVTQFNEKYKGKYRAVVDIIAFESLLDKSMTQFIAKNAFYDVLAVNSSWQNRTARYLEPLDASIKKNQINVNELYGANTVQAYTFQNKIIGLPVRIGMDVLYYRQDLLNEAGLSVPKTLEELQEAARKLTVGPENKRERYGFSFTAQSPYWTTTNLADFLFMGGVYFLDSKGQQANPALKGPIAQKIFELIKSMHDERLMPNPLEWTYDDNIVALQQGKLAMTFDDYMRAPLLEKPDVSKVAGKMNYAMMPYRADGPSAPKARGGWWLMSIDKNSKNKVAAFELVKFMSSYEAQRDMAINWANGPTILSIIEMPQFVKANPASLAAHQNLATIGIRDPIPNPQRPVIEKIVHEEIHYLLLGRKSAAEVGKSMFDRINQTLR